MILLIVITQFSIRVIMKLKMILLLILMMRLIQNLNPLFLILSITSKPYLGSPLP